MSLLTIRQKFNPTKIGGCKLWLDASSLVLDGVADGGAVTTWRDLSGNGNNVTQATADNKPTLQTGELNGRPVVRFDGTSDLMKTGTFSTALTQPNTLILVVKLAGTASDYRITDGIGSSNRHIIGINSSGPVWFMLGGTAATAGTPTTAPSIVVGVFNTTSSSLSVNGTTVGSGLNAGVHTLTGLTIGALNTVNNFYGGDMAEVILYDGGLVDTDRKRVERYLGRKYGIAVA